MSTSVAIWIIAGLSTLAVILRPLGVREAVWAVAGAVFLVVLGLLAPGDAWRGILKGGDVYFFLIGMMLLSELARKEGLFDWLAVEATKLARGSPTALFGLVYLTGMIVTIFLSNDATAVVLTPAVCAAARAAKVKDPKPYLFICAFIANAASFVLPISNPANLVVFGGGHMPPLGGWLRLFLLPSIMAIAVTYLMLWLTQRKVLENDFVAREVAPRELSRSAVIAGIGIGVTAVVLLLCSGGGIDLGLPTLLAGLGTAIGVLAAERKAPFDLFKDISWSVLPLVAGLFVLVEGLEKTGLIGELALWIQQVAERSAHAASAGAGILAALLSNLLNNLPVGLIAAGVVQQSHAPPVVSGGLLIGVDLGPNLSVTGSLATLLWLDALRRERLHVSGGEFLKTGLVVMFPALVMSLLMLILTAP
jgi:arsenical pump membrane protein